eukprot:c19141_g1_i1 orf=103-285(+)
MASIKLTNVLLAFMCFSMLFMMEAMAGKPPRYHPSKHGSYPKNPTKPPPKTHPKKPSMPP